MPPSEETANREQRLKKAVLESLMAEDDGQIVDAEDIARRFPDVAAELQAFTDTSQRLQQLAAPVKTDTSAARGVRLPDGQANRGRSRQDSDAGPSAGPDLFADLGVVPPLEQLEPEFTNFECLSRGGMGIVFKATQTRPQRTVALKFILLGALATDEERQRFHVEAQVLAKLRHPGIASIYQVGELKGHPYLVLEYIDGCSLAETLRNGPMPARLAAEYVLRICSAVQVAHEAGVIHRDLKPSNILLNQSDRPIVTDFGLARLLEGNSELTMTGQVIGTPGYMSPEVARGDVQGTIRSDVYGLGAILYSAITGRPPFQSDSVSQTLLLLLEREPPAPRTLAPSLAEDLESICLKCLEKSPSRRYASAKELAADLQRFLEGQPTQARPLGPLKYLSRKATRNPLVSSLICLLACALAVGTFAALNHVLVVDGLNEELGQRNELLSQLLQTSDRLRREEQQLRRQAQRLSYASDMAQAQSAARRQDVGQIADLLKAHLPETGEPDYRGFEWHSLKRRTPSADQQHHLPHAACYHINFHPDGDHYVCSRSDGVVTVVSMNAGEIVAEVDTGQVEVNSTAFHPHESVLACAGDDGTVSLRAWPSLTETARWQVHESRPVFGVAFFPDGERFVACGDFPEVQVRHYANGKLIASLTKHSRRVEAVAFATNGRHFATAGKDGLVIAWDAESLKPRRFFKINDTGVTAVSFSGDSQSVICGDGLGRVTSVLIHSGQHRTLFMRPDAITSISVGAKNRMAVADAGGAVTLASLDKVFAAPEQTPSGLTPGVVSMQADTEKLYAVAWHPRVNSLVTGGRSGTLSEWKTIPSEPIRLLPKAPAADFSRALRRSLTTAGTDRILNCSGRELRIWQPLSDTAQTLLTGTDSFVACDWRAISPPQNVAAEFEDNRDPHKPSESPPDGFYGVIQHPNILLLGSLQQGFHPLTLGSAEDPIEDFRFQGPDASAALIRRSSGLLQSVDLASGEVRDRFPRCHTFEVSRDGDFVWADERGSGDGIAQLRTRDWTIVRRIPVHHGTVRAITLSPDETEIATTGHDRSVAVFAAQTGALLRRFESLSARGADVAWSPDGRTLAVCTDTGSLRLLQATTLRDLGQLVSLSESLCALSFSSDGQWLMAATNDRKVLAFDGRVQSEP